MTDVQAAIKDNDGQLSVFLLFNQKVDDNVSRLFFCHDLLARLLLLDGRLNIARRSTPCARKEDSDNRGRYGYFVVARKWQSRETTYSGLNPVALRWLTCGSPAVV